MKSTIFLIALIASIFLLTMNAVVVSASNGGTQDLQWRHHHYNTWGYPHYSTFGYYGYPSYYRYRSAYYPYGYRSNWW